MKNDDYYDKRAEAADTRIDELQELLRDQAKGHQADARCWQIERSKLSDRVHELESWQRIAIETMESQAEEVESARENIACSAVDGVK